MQKTKKPFLPVLLSALRKARDMTVAAPFWFMAFVGFLLRLFMVRPFGALLALSMGAVWCWGNMPRIREYLQSVYSRLRGYEQKSLWYDGVGKEQIKGLIEKLTARGISYCNLAAEISLPPVSHWYAVSRELNRQNVLTQISENVFYIAWKLPESGAEQSV